jgi:pyruvate dehydrogenase E1 component alpha subunit
MRTPVHVRAAGFGVTGYHVDGNDVLAVHAVTQQAVAEVRAGGGPALIEAQTYRLGGHSSSDDPKRYRSDGEIAAWQAKDPIVRLERFLRKAGTPDSWFDDLRTREEEFAATVRAECKELHGDDLAAVFDQTYAEVHPVTELEKAHYVARRDQVVA